MASCNWLWATDSSGTALIAHWNIDLDLRSLAGAAADPHRAVEQARALLHADQAKAMPRRGQRALGIEATPVVTDREPGLLAHDAQVDRDRARLGVTSHVGKCLLGDPVERLFAARRQP